MVSIEKPWPWTIFSIFADQYLFESKAVGVSGKGLEHFSVAHRGIWYVNPSILVGNLEIGYIVIEEYSFCYSIPIGWLTVAAGECMGRRVVE